MKVSEFIMISCSLRVSNRYEVLSKMGTIKKMKLNCHWFRTKRSQFFKRKAD